MQGALVLTPACNLSLLFLVFIVRRSENIRLFIVEGKGRFVNSKLFWGMRSWSSRNICSVILKKKSWNRPGRQTDDPAEMQSSCLTSITLKKLLCLQSKTASVTTFVPFLGYASFEAYVSVIFNVFCRGSLWLSHAGSFHCSGYFC